MILYKSYTRPMTCDNLYKLKLNIIVIQKRNFLFDINTLKKVEKVLGQKSNELDNNVNRFYSLAEVFSLTESFSSDFFFFFSFFISLESLHF